MSDLLAKFMPAPAADGPVYVRELAPLMAARQRKRKRVARAEVMRTVERRVLPVLGDYRIADVTGAHLTAFAGYLASQRLSAARILAVKSATRSLFAEAPGPNPVDASDPDVWPARKASKRGALEVLSMRELTMLALAAREPGLGRLIGAAGLLGLREGELAARRFSDVTRVSDGWWALRVHTQADPKTGEVRPTKTKVARSIPLDGVRFDMLVEGSRALYRERLERDVRPEDLLWPCWLPTSWGGWKVRPWAGSTLLMRWHAELAHQGVKQDLDKPARFHCLRHTFVTQALAAGARIEDIELITHPGKPRKSAVLTYAHHDLGWEQKQDVIRRLQPDAEIMEALS